METLTAEQKMIHRLMRGPVPMKVVATGLELAALANLTRKGLAKFDRASRSYVRGFEVAR